MSPQASWGMSGLNTLAAADHAAAWLRRGWLLAGLVAMLLATGCATVPADQRVRADPWEGFNRQVFALNEAVDRVAVRPAAELYQDLVPRVVRQGVDNFYGNISDIWSSMNLVLQGKPGRALETGMRVGINTVFGLGGFLDVADEAGLERRGFEDFGQTLGVWGVPAGPYLVLPLLGPSSVRESAALGLDATVGGPPLVLKNAEDRSAATVLQVLTTRVRLLTAGRLLDGIALDKYVLMRDAYLARRRNLVYDGDPPEDDDPEPPAPEKPASPAKRNP